MRIKKQQTVCEWVGAEPEPPSSYSVVGLAIETLNKGILNGLRHPARLNSNGWFIWAGEYSEADDFFTPICVEHLSKYLDNETLEYLNLPPGYRFLIDGKDYEDVWFDQQLLNEQ